MRNVHETILAKAEKEREKERAKVSGRQVDGLGSVKQGREWTVEWRGRLHRRSESNRGFVSILSTGVDDIDAT